VWHGIAADESCPSPIGTEVAIKILHSHLLRHTEIRELFRAEHKFLAELPPHPAIIAGITAKHDCARPYIVMSLATGRDLRQHAHTDVPTAAVLAQIARGVHHLHQHGVIHGDIGPNNIIYDPAATTAVLCDLGVARATNSDGPVRGTHAYMAPEQVRGERWTPATDVFALGVCLWELTTGKRLFHRNQSFLSAAAVVEAEVPPTGLAAVDALLADALQKSPAARLPSASEFADRLAW
jgi:eukaryotic-like serine/threonine-protein kinase